VKHLPVRHLRGNAGRETRLLVVLSPRQIEVLWHLCLGHNNREVARALRISYATVKGYLATLYLELAVHSRLDLLRWTLQHPEGLHGMPVEPTLHPVDCPCTAPVCLLLRERAA